MCHWRELPPVAAESDIDATERPWPQGAGLVWPDRVMLLVGSLSHVRLEDAEGVSACVLYLVDNDPAHAFALQVHAAQVHSRLIQIILIKNKDGVASYILK